MRGRTIAALCLGLSLLGEKTAEAQTIGNCYPLTSDEAWAILENDEVDIRDAQFDWAVDKVGWGLTCLDDCHAGDFQVGLGVLKEGKCIYTVTNMAEPEVAGKSTEIVLRPVPLKGR